MAKAIVPDFSISVFKEKIIYNQETGLAEWSHHESVLSRFRGFKLRPDITGYVKLRIGKHAYSLHRLVYGAYVLGEWPDPDLEVDHINRDRGDNRLENLRLVTGADNCRNHKLRADNVSGVAGVVSLTVKSKNKYKKGEDFKYWRAYYRVPSTGKLVNKNFPFTEEGKQQAIAHRKSIEETILLPAGYSTSHGEPGRLYPR